MVQFELRYALRQPESAGDDFQPRYQTCVEQCDWADKLGFHSVMISEHHGSTDGYMPSPMVLGGAIASRTKDIRIRIASLIAPLHHPVRLAEDLATLDILSEGRLDPVLSGGYVGYEFDAMSTSLAARKSCMEEIAPFLRQAWTGEPFQWQGKTIRVTPRPVQRPGPPIWMGGASKVAARRAARLADVFLPADPELFEAFNEELEKLGKEGNKLARNEHIIWLSDDPDKFWSEFGPSALHENNAYGKWYSDWKAWNGYITTKDTEELKETGLYPVMTPDELIKHIETAGDDPIIMFHPMAGGFDPERSWSSLQLFENKVIPLLNEKGIKFKA